tara:strand:- start:17056 stop:17529 length:474 start_codon:yes stop_codon:yes gene_type:complete
MNQEQLFKNRNADQDSEKKAVEWMESNNLSYVRYGLDALKSGLPIWNIPQFVRSAPDYIIFTNAVMAKDKKPMFLEFKSFYKSIKLKTRDLEEYIVWGRSMPLYILFYDIQNNAFSLNKLDSIVKSMFSNLCKMGHYPESADNTYYFIEKEWLVNFK